MYCAAKYQTHTPHKNRMMMPPVSGSRRCGRNLYAKMLKNSHKMCVWRLSLSLLCLPITSSSVAQNVARCQKCVDVASSMISAGGDKPDTAYYHQECCERAIKCWYTSWVKISPYARSHAMLRKCKLHIIFRQHGRCCCCPVKMFYLCHVRMQCN